MPLNVSFKSTITQKINILSIVIIILLIPSFLFTTFNNIDNAKRSYVLGVNTNTLDPLLDNSDLVSRNLGVAGNRIEENIDNTKALILIGMVLLIVAIILVNIFLSHMKKSNEKNS